MDTHLAGPRPYGSDTNDWRHHRKSSSPQGRYSGGGRDGLISLPRIFQQIILARCWLQPGTARKSGRLRTKWAGGNLRREQLDGRQKIETTTALRLCFVLRAS